MIKSPDGGFIVGDGLEVNGNTISAVQQAGQGGGYNDIVLIHMYNVYGNDDVIGMQASMNVEQLTPYIKKNKLIIGHNSDNHTMTPLFIYDYDTNDDKKITAIYWYQQDVVYNKMLMYKQTDTEIVEFQSNGH